ncbi:fibronectin type III domain-containing protein [Streptomyces nigra]|uniref:fibronectin type III domain-containing protein n=1 Tax=Streptomyces TaxID=1883 RepID=UPI000D5262D5|nr:MULTISPECIES: PA14 domain-containing protein [Streptomyces]AWE51478.1 cellulose 1,4-beta-cellobiosidase [Streptomyces nigra]MCF2537850.1 PA14 domain-containing protein [Streptomyces sp. FB2]
MNPARRATAAAATTVALATAGTLLTTVTPASAAVTCTSPVFKRQFFANTSFSGTAKKTDCDSAIDQSWTGAPITGLPKDNFGVRWSVTRDFGSGGPFTLTASALDGIRVHLDGTRKIDLWKNTSTTVTKTLNLTIPSGRHTLRVDYVNWTGSAKVKFTYTPRTTASVDKTKPLAPTGAKAVYDTTTGKTKLTWTASKEMDLSGYRVYRRLKGASFSATPLATTTSTSYTDTTLPKTGATYYYEVRARDKAGNESTGSTDQPVTTVDLTPPGRVGPVAVLGTTAGNSVSWPASTAKDVHHYEVWGAPDGQSDPDGPTLVLGTSWTDVTAPVGSAYRYTVQAVDAAGNIAAPSEPQVVTRPAASTTPAPSGLTSTLGDSMTWLRWTPAQGSPAASSYRVYRRTAADGGWTLLGSVSTASYEDRTAPKGKAYYYVAAVDGTGADSVPSPQLTVDRLTPATATGPAQPRLTLVSSGGTRHPIIVKAEPGAGDEGRLLQGYTWDISGACGDSGLGHMSTTGTIEWTPPYNGPCMVTVFAVDAYGRTGERGAWLEFTVNR